jgi:SynChlorMet cassette protein ScmC
MEGDENLRLALADGSTWQIQGEGEGGSEIASMLGDVMMLHPSNKPCRRLSITTDFRKCASKGLGCIEVVVPTIGINGVSLSDVLACATHAICLDVQSRNGLLIHGALAERKGFGAILTGPSGVGKTTASKRIQPPWRSLSDDLTLVTCDDQGRYWAHPWPTWSRFDDGGLGGSWDVGYAIPLKALFFLSQAREDNFDLLGPGRAACMLLETAEQALYRLSRLDDDLSGHRLQRFENACVMVNAILCVVLYLSQTGTFWEQMDAAMGLNPGDGLM